MNKLDSQDKIIAKMSAEEKILASIRLYRSAFELKCAAIKQLNPNLSPLEVNKIVSRIFLNART